MSYFVGAVCAFALPRIFNYLSALPENGPDPTRRMDRIRLLFNEVEHAVVTRLSNGQLTIVSDIIVKNTWLTLLFFHFLEKQIPSPVSVKFFFLLFSVDVGLFGIRSALNICAKEVKRRADLLRPIDTPPRPLPKKFENDRVLQLFTCAIDLTPARNPIGDPNGVTIFDYNSLMTYRALTWVSPMTRAVVSPEALKSKRAAQAVIDARLVYLMKTCPLRERKRREWITSVCFALNSLSGNDKYPFSQLFRSFQEPPFDFKQAIRNVNPEKTFEELNESPQLLQWDLNYTPPSSPAIQNLRKRAREEFVADFKTLPLEEILAD